MFTEHVTKNHQLKTGFSLIELIIVIALAGILSVTVATFIAKPMVGYVNQASRATLVDNADIAVRRMSRDIQRAVPNSIRVGSGNQVIEFFNTVEAIRYRAAGPGTPLNFNTEATIFDVLGNFQTALPGVQGYYAIIYNTGATNSGGSTPTAGVNVYAVPSLAPGTTPPTPPPAGSTVITAPGDATIITHTPPTFDQVDLDGGVQFAFPSPQQRLYISDGPVSYLCDLAAGTLVRYWGYTVAATQMTTTVQFTNAGANAATLATGVTACNFNYSAGTLYRTGVTALQISLTQSGETVTLMNQVSELNSP